MKFYGFGRRRVWQYRKSFSMTHVNIWLQLYKVTSFRRVLKISIFPPNFHSGFDWFWSLWMPGVSQKHEIWIVNASRGRSGILKCLDWKSILYFILMGPWAGVHCDCRPRVNLAIPDQTPSIHSWDLQCKWNVFRLLLFNSMLLKVTH